MIHLARTFREHPEVRYGLTTMCVGLGMGGTVIWENPHHAKEGGLMRGRVELESLLERGHGPRADDEVVTRRLEPGRALPHAGRPGGVDHPRQRP